MELGRFLPFPKGPKVEPKRNVVEAHHSLAERLPIAGVIIDQKSPLGDAIPSDVYAQMAHYDGLFVENNRIR